MDHRPNVKSKTRKLLKENTGEKKKENTGENLSDLRLGKDFLDMTTKARSIKEQVDKLDFICLGR